MVGGFERAFDCSRMFRMNDEEFRSLPSVDKVISNDRVQQLSAGYPFDLIVEVIRRQLDRERQSIKNGKKPSQFEGIVEAVIQETESFSKPSLRHVINATGVILHTNLGRAPMSREAIKAMEMVSSGYSNLEFDLEKGDRGSRNAHLEKLLCQLTGAEAALVVNNNAAAVLLTLSSLAKRKEVVVSRGQAVEIGGGFRIPDVMRQSLARLVEVGTTNCTYIEDYEQAITEKTVALLWVHPSNFRVEGFTHAVELQEMVAAAQKHNIMVIDDLGSGCFIETGQFGLYPEPTVQQSVSAGADVICFSGDKLVGGPQAGIIVGKKVLIEKLKKHPLARAMRLDKSRLAGLWATLLHYLKEEALEKVPIWRMISMPLPEIETRIGNWSRVPGLNAKIIDGVSMIGGGSMPGETLPTRLLSIEAPGKKGSNLASQLSILLRKQDPPVVGRIDNDHLMLDPRTVLLEEDDQVVKALMNLAEYLQR
jgi:L-seryl-tRNA(Ser) seleniumtransferase